MFEDTREIPVETGLFWLSSRYYFQELERYIQPIDVSTLNSQDINGLNLYSYANNNPISISYGSSGFTGIAVGTAAAGLAGAIGSGFTGSLILV